MRIHKTGLLTAAAAAVLASVAAPASGPKVLVCAANPLAVEAGVNVLRQGGSAIDAAVAVQAVLGGIDAPAHLIAPDPCRGIEVMEGAVAFLAARFQVPPRGVGEDSAPDEPQFPIGHRQSPA